MEDVYVYVYISPDGQYRNQIDYILCSQRWINSMQSAKTRPGADCGSDHELLIAKFRLKLKKVRKITRPFRYDLSQIPYVFTVELTNKFKGLDLVDILPEELWTEVINTKTGGDQSHPKGKKHTRRQNGCLKKRPYKQL